MSSRRLEFFIPGRFPSPNVIMRIRNPYMRNKVIQEMRERAWLIAFSAMNEARIPPFRGPATVKFTMLRRRFLDIRDNDGSACKHARDGLVELLSVVRHPITKKRIVLKKPGVIPNGDGPTSGYTFTVDQEKVKTDAEEGVRVVIEGE